MDMVFRIATTLSYLFIPPQHAIVVVASYHTLYAGQRKLPRRGKLEHYDANRLLVTWCSNSGGKYMVWTILSGLIDE